MTYQVPIPSLAFLEDLRFLVATCKGPQKAKSTLSAWVDLVEAQDPQIWTLEYLKLVCESLVTLAHANAAFNRVPTPFFYRGPAALSLEDTGGHLLAKKSMIAIIDGAPLCNDRRSKLLRYVLEITKAQMSQLEKLLPKS